MTLLDLSNLMEDEVIPKSCWTLVLRKKFQITDDVSTPFWMVRSDWSIPIGLFQLFGLVFCWKFDGKTKNIPGHWLIPKKENKLSQLKWSEVTNTTNEAKANGFLVEAKEKNDPSPKNHLGLDSWWKKCPNSFIEAEAIWAPVFPNLFIYLIKLPIVLK